MYSLENALFSHRRLNRRRLLAYGFTELDDGYHWSSMLLDMRFGLHVFISAEGRVSTRVLDADTNEEYVLYRVATASGAFVHQVRDACEQILSEIAMRCFDTYAFVSEGANAVIQYIEKRYGDFPEFLWKKFPSNAIFRRNDNGKWYAALLTVQRGKLGLAGDQAVEILDLRMHPSEAESLVDRDKFYPGYHMNKKHWFTICLDGSVPDRVVMERVDLSYEIAKKR